MRDPYSVLGVTKSADNSAIKSAYRKLAKKYHPDQNPDDPKAQGRFSEVSSAYDVVGDEEKRRAFDRGEIDASGNPTMAGHNPFGGGQSRAQGGPNANFDDLFSTFSRGGGGPGGAGPGGAGSRFSHGRGPSGPSSSFGQQAGAEDILRNMFGAEGPLGGQGDPRGTRQQRGHAQQRPTKGADIKANVRVSLEEIAAGEKVTVSIPGQGSVKIALPKGVEHGQTIRLKSKGADSPNGGKPGDGLVSVHFATHPVFKADGETLTMDMPVTLDEAVLGARISVTTLDGTVSLNLPAGTQSGRTLRLKERGLTSKAGKRGDLLVKVLIKLPEEGDEALEALMRRWRSDGRYTVR